ncbi:MAG TPA: LCP family protein [Gaiellaceae bacterium]|nr:LCP family protein [Gaiellaceae bacterium]
MRTTLKRGQGRTAFDGNGNGNSTLPPDALSPMTLYSADAPPPKSRMRRVGRFFAWLGLLLLMVAGGLGGGVYLWLHEAVGALNPTDRPTKDAITHLVPPVPGQPVIALALGYDHRAGQGNAPSRSDSMMLLRLDPKSKTISQLSLPRDLAVTIHCPSKSGVAPYTDKINAAYSDCGPSGSVLTVEAVTGLKINYLITVNFTGFKKVVNTIGGVWVDVDRRYFNNDSGPYGYAAINLQPGYQRLTGGAALDFVRFRHTDSDFVRVARQQLFVQAMKEQLKQHFDLSTALAIIQAASDNVEVGIGGGQKVDIHLILRYGQFIYGLPGGHFFQTQIQGLTGNSQVTTDSSNITAAVEQFTHPSIKQVNEASRAAFGEKVTTKTATPKPSQTRILVLNGNGVAGSATDAKIRLAGQGYQMLEPPAGKQPNAPTFNYYATAVYYQSWSKRAKAAAASLASVMAPAKTGPIPADLQHLCTGAVMLCVVVGQTYHNSISPLPPPPKPIVHQKPNVSYDRSATESLITTAQRQVPFPLMVPNMLESSSTPDAYGIDQPLRVYDITDKNKAVRLIFRMGGQNAYWGIEETNWQGAPVLNEKSFQRKIGGRTYQFYYHGTHLHMVVLQVGSTSYWVVNSLLDDLSNETMISIAENLSPLHAGHVTKATKN